MGLGTTTSEATRKGSNIIRTRQSGHIKRVFKEVVVSTFQNKRKQCGFMGY